MIRKIAKTQEQYYRCNIWNVRSCLWLPEIRPESIVLVFVANENDGAERKAIKILSALLCVHACECICANLHLKQPSALLPVFVFFHSE